MRLEPALIPVIPTTVRVRDDVDKMDMETLQVLVRNNVISSVPVNVIIFLVRFIRRFYQVLLLFYYVSNLNIFSFSLSALTL